MADRHDSGSCVGNDVWVQVPFSALFFSIKSLEFNIFQDFFVIFGIVYWQINPAYLLP